MFPCFWVRIHQFSRVFFFGCYCVIPVTLFIIRSKGSTEKNSRRSGQPSSKQGLDRRLIFSVLPLLRIIKRVTGVTQQHHPPPPPPKKKCLSRCRDSHQRTQRIHSRQVSFIYVIEKEKVSTVVSNATHADSLVMNTLVTWGRTPVITCTKCVYSRTPMTRTKSNFRWISPNFSFIFTRLTLIRITRISLD